MIKQLLLLGVASLGISAVSASAATTQSATAKGGKAQALKAVGGKAQLGAWGVDLSGMDRNVKPGDSFFKFVNGTWFKNTEIPADQSSWGGFIQLAELSNQRTRDILEAAAKSNAPAGSNERKVGDFYAAFMDEAAIEAKGVTPLKPFFDKIAAINTSADLVRFFGEASRIGLGGPVAVGAGQDLKNNSHYAVYMRQAGLGLPDRDYYLDDKNPKFVEIASKYQQHIAKMLTLAGISDAEARAKRIFELEKKIAAVHWTRVEQRQVEKTYNPMTMTEIAAAAPGLDLPAFLQGAGIPAQQRIIVSHPSAIAGAAKLMQSEPIESWKDYYTFRTIAGSASVLPKAFVEESFAFNGKTLAGTPQLRERWKRGAGLVGGGMGEAVGQLYVARYFPPESKVKMDELVGNLIKAMDVRLANLDWMTPETKSRAREKLASFTPKIGYPEKWRDYSALEIVPGDLVGNAIRVRAFEYQRNVEKLGKPVDRREWFTTPQTVNAFANPLQNEIVFPAAILQAPFFDPNADPAVNYGAIGAVIGHEISHHFDDQGSKFDKTGNLAVWWAAADTDKFKALSGQVVKQYGEYEPLPGAKVNGQLTLGENIADLAGLAIAYDAYKMSMKGKKDRAIDGFTGEQRFFLGFGQAWRQKYRDPYLQQLMTVDTHTPSHFRPHVLRNFDPWYAAFGVKNGELYLPPEQRIKIW